ncbi:MAG: LPP20 family lipoprotein [Candidatus Sericytochromatia bacterium]
MLRTSFLASWLCLSLLPAQAAPVERAVGAARLDWTAGTITVTGSGVAKPGGNLGQQRLLAQRAAITDAYRLLAEAVNGVRVLAETTVKDFTTESDVIRLQVEAVLRGAQPVGRPRYLSDGTVEIDVRLPIFGPSSLAQALAFGELMQQQTAQPYSSLQSYLAFRGTPLGLPPSEAPSAPPRGWRQAQAETYTGLIIDASGLAAEPAMGPFIVAAGMRVHPNQAIDVNPALIVQQGPLHYVEDLAAARADVERVGEQPLVIRAKAAIGDPVHSNILLDQSSARRVLEADQIGRFLEGMRVTLVL